MPQSEPKHTNRLIKETSPYLLQHAHNPVDWYAWGEEALEAAQTQDKPILLSIGYSACHWCHVMEHQSFEDEEIAKLMNDHFINIKVDREERPDLDSIYMNFVQMTVGSGGWPLTVFLTPDQVPFYGGTYFPPEDSYGRPGFKRILTTLAEVYRTRRQELEAGRETTIGRLRETVEWKGTEQPLEQDLLEQAYTKLATQFDPKYGGFGGAPKFPSSMVLAFLLRYHQRLGSKSALDIVRLSLDQMARGGIYDQLGGGFHRYSVDERWLVPHFEKMLYDQALLSRLYLEAYQLTGRPHYREVVEETLRYVQREMTDVSGGFYSSLDADSEGEEGRFYLWSIQEVAQLLDGEEAKIFQDFFDVTGSGNFEGRSILNQRFELEGYSRSLGMPSQELKGLLDQARVKLLNIRDKRARPGLDDKILAAWNGLMLTSFAEAAFVLNEKEFLETARHNAEFLASEMLVNGRLARSWKQGRPHLNGYLEDYALVIEGWLRTYEVSGETCWLEKAQSLLEVQLELFWDQEAGDFYFTSSDHEDLLVRQKEFLDNATPSGNSTTALNLLRLAVLLGKDDYRQKAQGLLRRIARGMSLSPLAFGNWLQALDFHFGPSQEIAVVGNPSQREGLIHPVRKRFIPNRVLVLAPEEPEELAHSIPLLRGKIALNHQPTLFLCRDYACREPVTSAAAVERLLEGLAS